MDLPVNFKFDVRIRPRLLARAQLSEGDVTKYLEGLPDLQPQADAIDLAQPALTSLEERERAASRPSAVVARPVPSAPPAERSAPVSIAPSAEPVDEGWDEDDDEDDVDNDDDDEKDTVDEKDTADEKDAETQASPQASEEEPKAAGGEEEE